MDEPDASGHLARSCERELRALMSAHVGVVRSGDGLARALRAIAAIERHASSPAMRNTAIAALLVAAAAYRRQESRGAHFRADYPQTDPAPAVRHTLTYEQAVRIAGDAAARPARAVV